MEKIEKEKEIVKIVLKVLDELKFSYDKNEEELESMTAYYNKKEKMYDGKEWDYYSVSFYTEYNEVMGDVFLRTCYVDAETMQVKGIHGDHGVWEIIYNDKGIAVNKKFISPSFPYDKQ
ncbi:hypothetical protein SAMN05421856_101385 [Chryseobacterium taichungense]|uniref:Uncharacterized protein n=1 Tax=Chryseobacterium taichungense TaxID=295069 RepID=A0A1H7W0Y2_9FLAO|nr:hypothetical protein [Chryseobacterium taichungense]SEM14667.1 hypothetical protein SAMN05421856_101385 [Chryseobacterium taichungense]